MSVEIPLGDIVDWTRMPMPPGRRLRWARFDAADEVQVLCRAGNPMSCSGVGLGLYTPIRRRDPDECGHVTTICRACRRQWEEGYFLGVFTHGTASAYKNQGCRCGPCRADMLNAQDARRQALRRDE